MQEDDLGVYSIGLNGLVLGVLDGLGPLGHSGFVELSKFGEETDEIKETFWEI